MSEPTTLLFLTVLTSLSIQPEPAELCLNFLLPSGLVLGGVCGISRSCGSGQVSGFLRRLIVASRYFSCVLIKSGVQIDQIKTSLVRYGIIRWTLGRGDARALGHWRGRIDVGLMLLVVLELAKRQSCQRLLHLLQAHGWWTTVDGLPDDVVSPCWLELLRIMLWGLSCHHRWEIHLDFRHLGLVCCWWKMWCVASLWSSIALNLLKVVGMMMSVSCALRVEKFRLLRVTTRLVKGKVDGTCSAVLLWVLLLLRSTVIHH